MPKKPEVFTISDPQQLFISCESFRFTTQLLLEKQAEGATIYIFAYLVNDAFTAELLLKCVDAARSGTHVRGHKLDELFGALPTQDQVDIERNYDAQSVGTQNHIPLRDLLAETSSLFEMVRYWHEGKLKPTKMNLLHLVTALRQTVLKIRPEWEPQVDLSKQRKRPTT